MKSKNISIIIVIIIFLVIKIFVVDFARVTGNSMNPTLRNNDLLLYLKINNKFNRFDIVIVRVDDKKYIKRIIGLPGEKIEYKDNKLLVNGKIIEEKFNSTNTNDFSLNEICPYETIPENKFLILGDNREISNDSRHFGLIDISNIEGKIIR